MIVCNFLLAARVFHRVVGVVFLTSWNGCLPVASSFLRCASVHLISAICFRIPSGCWSRHKHGWSPRRRRLSSCCRSCFVLLELGGVRLLARGDYLGYCKCRSSPGLWGVLLEASAYRSHRSQAGSPSYNVHTSLYRLSDSLRVAGWCAYRRGGSRTCRQRACSSFPGCVLVERRLCVFLTLQRVRIEGRWVGLACGMYVFEGQIL